MTKQATAGDVATLIYGKMSEDLEHNSTLALSSGCFGRIRFTGWKAPKHRLYLHLV